MDCIKLNRIQWRRLVLPVLSGGLMLASGCATTPALRPAAPVFYPGPPAAPRLQYLTSISKAEDIEPPKRWLSFLFGAGRHDRPIVKPYGLAIQGEQLYLCDTVLAGLEIIDLKQKKFEYFTPTGAEHLRTPVNLALDAEGVRYVADPARGQILVFRRDGEPAGFVGEATGMKPTDVLVRNGRIFATDLKEHRVNVYRQSDRQWLFCIPGGETNEEARLYQPVNLAIDGEGRLYVADAGAFCVKQYDPGGKFLRRFGGQGDRPGEFARPRGVAVDRDGLVYVVDAAAQVVQIFDRDGRLLLFFGEPGASSASLCLPAKVVVDYENAGLFRKYASPGFNIEYLVWVTSQYGERKVSVYGFGHGK